MAMKTVSTLAQPALEPSIRRDGVMLIGGAELRGVKNNHDYRLLLETASRLPADLRIDSLMHVAFREMHANKTVAMTTCNLEFMRSDVGVGMYLLKQKVYFNTHFLSQLSDKATIWIMAREFAHLWLNEHVKPEQSQEREKEADKLALEWGYGEYFTAYNEEAEDA